jgi:hypothetical protein
MCIICLHQAHDMSYMRIYEPETWVRAWATGGCVDSIYTEIHRSGKMSVNHIMYILVYTEQYSAKHVKLGTLFLV